MHQEKLHVDPQQLIGILKPQIAQIHNGLG
jgi:hypothetical protein